MHKNEKIKDFKSGFVLFNVLKYIPFTWNIHTYINSLIFIKKNSNNGWEVLSKLVDEQRDMTLRSPKESSKWVRFSIKYLFLTKDE